MNRPQPLYSQKIIIGSEELNGQDIEHIVRRKIDSLDKSPKVVRSTAIIIKTSKVTLKSPSKPNGQVAGSIDKHLVKDKVLTESEIKRPLNGNISQTDIDGSFVNQIPPNRSNGIDRLVRSGEST